jgi:o-succinylbenzoate synthase
LRLTAATGQVSWGEIAPVDFLGTESIEQAEALCRSLPAVLTPAILSHIPDSLPSCQFGLAMALEQTVPSLPPTAAPVSERPYSYLLPTGAAALQAWTALVAQGASTFKWKIGAALLVDELRVFEQLRQCLPPGSCLRLDANGGLTEQQAGEWLQRCDDRSQPSAAVEFLEQPLPVSQFHEMRQLAERYQTPIALDESVTTVRQLETCYHQGWRGIFVVKPAIAGSYQQLRTFCQTYPVDIVWSSVFETAVTQRFIQQRLIPSVPTVQPRAIGFGVNQWFNDAWLNQTDMEQLWQSL